MYQFVADPTNAKGQQFTANLIDQEQRRLQDRLTQVISTHITSAAQHAAVGASEVAKPALLRLFEGPRIDQLFSKVALESAAAQLMQVGEDGLNLEQRAARAAEFWGTSAKRAVAGLAAKAPADQTLSERRRGVVDGLRSYLAPRSNIEDKESMAAEHGVPKNPHYPATRLAETELQAAYTQATIDTGAATPTYRGITWSLSPLHVKPDECDVLADQHFFAAGEEPRRPHPHCRCLVVPQNDTTQQFATRLNKWASDPSAEPQIQDWYTRNAQILGQPKRQVA